MLPQPRLDWRSASLFVVLDPDWRQKVFLGGLLLLFPPLGWPVALGYRKTLIPRLFQKDAPLMPSWRGNVLRYWIEGMKAVGVMAVYFAPLFLFIAVRFQERGVPELPLSPLLFIFGGCFFLFPFLGPTLIALPSAIFGGDTFSSTEVLSALAYFAGATFILPAGFLQVSRTGSYLSAFRLDKSLRFIRDHGRLYLEAWIYSSLTAVIGHVAFPFSPWGVFWSYQSIVYSFNEIRLHTGDAADRGVAAGDCWIRRIPASLESYRRESHRFTESYEPDPEPAAASEVSTKEEPEPFAALRLAEIRAPLPAVVERWISH